MTDTETRSSPLADALAAAQAELSDPRREKSGQVRGKPNYRYAGLDDLLQAVRPVLARHGIAITQPLVMVGDRLVLCTRLLHGSGEVLESHHPLSWQGSPQDHGSELTYARRYSLEALVCVAATDDDDASTATEQHHQRGQSEQRQAQRAHHESWDGAKAWFCGRLRDHGCTYTVLADWCTAHGKARPSEVDDAARSRMLDWVASPAGQAALGISTGGAT